MNHLVFSKHIKSMLNLLENLNYFLEGQSLRLALIDKVFKVSIRTQVNDAIEVI